MDTNQNQTDWAQKYRPTRLEDVVLPLVFRNRLIHMRDTGEVQPLLLHGKAGRGKTTVGMLINVDNVYKINCSIRNGIDTIRQLESFVTPSLDGSRRVVLMDEADNLSKDAQKGLRGLIEDLSICNHFVLTANYLNDISDPIRSRCEEVNFDLLDGDLLLRDEMTQRCLKILKNEKVEHVDKSMVGEVVRRNYPDMRKVLNRLQNEVRQF